MKKFPSKSIFVVLALTSVLMISVLAQAATSSWAFFVELTPSLEKPGMYQVTVPLQVMDQSRQDLADLRLYDGNGAEIPYALRIQRDVDVRKEIGGSLFNKAIIGSTASEVSVDLGEEPGEHNEVEVQTSGMNFRRRVSVEGSDSGTDWKMLQANALVFYIQSQGETVQSDRVSYPTSRYRFLRVRVFVDELTDKAPPVITSVNALRVVREKSELTTWHVNMPGYQLLRNQGAPASAWNIDLGARVPCDRLILDIDNPSFSRPYEIEAGDDPQNLRLVASGELTRRADDELKPIVIPFHREEHVRRLRLLITDFSNQTLTISAIQAGAPARQLIFELKETPAHPLRLYFGNPKATPPRYDFEKELEARLSTESTGTERAMPIRVGIGQVSNNPNYQPEPVPLTERVPWLIYLVLAISSVALALVLFRLARSAVPSGADKQDDAGDKEDSSTPISMK